MQVVNTSGVSYMKAVLQNKHKRGFAIAENPKHMQTWVQSVECHANEGNGPYFEISAFDSFSGHTEVIDMPHGTMSELEIPEPDRVSLEELAAYDEASNDDTP